MRLQVACNVWSKIRVLLSSAGSVKHHIEQRTMDIFNCVDSINLLFVVSVPDNASSGFHCQERSLYLKTHFHMRNQVLNLQSFSIKLCWVRNRKVACSGLTPKLNYSCVLVSSGNTLYAYLPLRSSRLPVAMAQPDKRLLNETARKILCFVVIRRGISGLHA